MISVKPVSGSDSARWDNFAADCPAATFLHTRRFLSYHGDSFKDMSLMFFDEKDKLCGIFPAAESQPGEITSHPGATYGGILHDGKLRGTKMIDALRAVINYYCENGYKRLIYKAVPHLFHRQPQEDDIYALFRVGARLLRVDLSSAVDLQRPRKIRADRKWSRNKAERAGVRIIPAAQRIPEVWRLISRNLQKHNAVPTHSESELQTLAERFPKNIIFRAAVTENELLAAGVFFFCNFACHSQYLATTAQGHEVRALDGIITATMEEAAAKGIKWFSFGASTTQNGTFLNDSLHDFKCSFGGGGVTYASYLLETKSSTL